MKKVVLSALVLAMVLVAAVGCTQAPPAPQTVKIYEGTGTVINFRRGPGSDETGTPVYSFNVVMADATFDADGKILDVFVDILEVATPNYDGEQMPHFPGWPGTEGYNEFNHETGKVDGKADTTLEVVEAQVNEWQTKRDRGDNYHMNPRNEWYKQMNYYQEFFKGKTIEEIEAWVAKFTSDRNGRPLNPDTDNEADKAKADKLTAEEKQQIVDFRTGATMSVNDAHGDIIGAIKEAFANRHEVTITVPAPTK